MEPDYSNPFSEFKYKTPYNHSFQTDMPPDQPRPSLILKHWFCRDILCSGWKWQSEEPKDVSLKVMRFRERQWDFAGIGRLFTWYLS